MRLYKCNIISWLLIWRNNCCNFNNMFCIQITTTTKVSSRILLLGGGELIMWSTLLHWGVWGCFWWILKFRPSEIASDGFWEHRRLVAELLLHVEIGLKSCFTCTSVYMCNYISYSKCFGLLEYHIIFLLKAWTDY